MVNKACLFRSKTTYVYLRLQHKQCKLVLKLQAQDYSGRIVNSRYAGGNQQVADNMLFCCGLVFRKRLSKYIFYSSFSLLTFATKK